MTIIVEITKTTKGYGPNAQRRRHACNIHRFDTLASAKAGVKEMYDGKAPSASIFVDTKSRGTIRTGMIYSGKDRDGYRAGEAWTWQDWVSFSRVISEDERTAESIDLAKERI